MIRKHGTQKSQTARGLFMFTSVLERSTNKLWGGHFIVPAEVAKRLISKRSRRVVCQLNNAAAYQCAMIPHGNGGFVITVNKKLRDSLGLDFGMNVNVTLRKDSSKYGLPVPEELKELLLQDRQGSDLFHSLTKGKQRTLLYIIGSAKTSPRRLERAVRVIKHLKVNLGTINYRQLNESLRSSRYL
jgi:Domain of unknown function (DUF1905)/Bacteriocin-protection, YdeI or OmpD-Associated